MPTQLTVSIEDDKGKIAKHSVYVSGTLAQLDLWLDEYLLRLSAVIDGAIVAASLTVGVDIPSAAPALPSPVADVEQRASWSLAHAGAAGASAITTVPCWNEAYTELAFNVRQIDIFDPAVESYTNMLTAAFGANPCRVLNNRGDVIIAIRKSRYIFRKTTRAKGRK